MRNILLLLVVSLMCGCRTLHGDYIETFGPPGGQAEYHFSKNGTFTYKSHYDVGGAYGNGTYTVRFGRLKLKFNHAFTESYMSAGWCFTYRDSTEKGRSFHVTVRDENKEPLPLAIVSFGVSRDSLMENRATDLDGKCRFVCNDSSDSVVLRVRTGIYPTFEKLISVKAYDSIVLYLYSDPNWGRTAVDSGAVWKYNLRKGESKGLELIEHRIERVEVAPYEEKLVHRKIVHKLTKQKKK